MRPWGGRGRAAACAWLAASACGTAPAPAPGHLDLLASSNLPLLVAETAGAWAAPYLPGFFQREVDPGGRPYRWAGAEPCRVAVAFAATAERTVEIEAQALAWPGAPPLCVQFSFDGKLVAELEFTGEWETKSVALGEVAGGLHELELRFERAERPLDRVAGSKDARALSIAVRALRFRPATYEARIPRLARGRLELPPGTRASWTLRIPPGAHLRARMEKGTGADEAALFLLEEDGQPPRPLERGDLTAFAGRVVRLALVNPGSRERDVVVSEIGVDADPPARLAPPASRRPPAPVLVVIGSVETGFDVALSTTDAGRARRCLLTGREEAALGLREGLDESRFLACDVDDAVTTLTGRTPRPVAFVFADAEAAALIELARARVPRLVVIQVGLPADPGDVRVHARIDGAVTLPVNARDIDILPTALALAGMAPLPSLSGIDLEPALRAEAPSLVREVAFVWDGAHAVAIAGDRRVETEVGKVGYGRSVVEEYLADQLARRRRSLEWVIP